MQMAAARWDMTATQMSWVFSEPPKENPFRIVDDIGPVVEHSASDIAKMFFGKVGK